MSHRLLCMAFLVTTTGAYWIVAGTPARYGTYYLLLHGGLTVWMLGCWLSDEVATPSGERWVLTTAVLARLVLVGVTPCTSHDVERYIWDGAVTLAGYDPYILAPAAAPLATLRDLWPTSTAHVTLTTIYPPGALALFTLAARAGPDAALLVWKALATTASIATVLVTAALLRRRGLTRHLPLVALSPLLVLEGGVGAHLDAFSTLALVVALWAFDRRRLVVAGAALGCGMLTKFLPVLAALPMAIGLARRDAAVLLAAAVGVAVAGYGAAVLAGLSPIGGLLAFFAQARFGSPLFAALAGMTSGAALLAACGVVAVALLVASVWTARRGWGDSGVECALAAPLAVSPVVYPWYLSPLAVCVALSPSAIVLLWLTTAPLTYEVLNVLGASGEWTPAGWPLVIIGVGWLVGALIDIVRPRWTS